MTALANRRFGTPRSASAWIRLWPACLLLAAGCGTANDPPSGGDAPSPTSPSSAAAAPAKEVDPFHPVVRIETNLGAITLQLDAELARGTVQNFLNYVNEGFYKETIFHYIVPDKIILGGGYTPAYQPKPTHGPIRNEAHNGGKNLRGTIAMARDPAIIDSATAQFFINLEDAPRRDYTGDTPDDYGYCVFGTVTDGLDVVERISRAATADMSAQGGDLSATPQIPVVIMSIQVVM
jgi:cyclophilin family peptidyl-prolyl cis-trans isomerase